MNSKLLHLVIFISLPFMSNAQYHWDLGGSLGASNYLGDIGGMEQTRRDFVADLKFSQTHLAANVFARYKISQQFSAKAGFTYGRLSGNDNLSTNPGRQGRNLSFRNDVLELAATAEFNFINLVDARGFRYANTFKAYVFAGVGGFYNNPKANDNGVWVALQPLKTEGVDYSRFQVTIPAGVGVYYTINKKNRIGWELGWRTTFTDYVDDISTVYADPSTLSTKSAQLANRHDELPSSSLSELPNANNYSPGNKRGDPTHNDSYIFSTFNYSHVLKGESKVGRDWKKKHPRYRNIVFNDKFGYGRKRNIRIKL